MLRRTVILGLLTAPLWAALVDAQEAGPTPAAIQAALHSETGWVSHASKDGVQVYRKDIPGLEVPGFKGVKDMAVDARVLFTLISDIGAQPKMNELLAESRVLYQADNRLHYYQVLESPVPLVSDRFWFCKATNQWDVGGRAGHHRQVWDRLDTSLYPEAYASVMQRFPGAVHTPINHGSWELLPLADGRTRVSYRIVSHPGGSISDSLAMVVTGQTLPDNLLAFEKATLARMAQP